MFLMFSCFINMMVTASKFFLPFLILLTFGKAPTLMEHVCHILAGVLVSNVPGID